MVIVFEALKRTEMNAYEQSNNTWQDIYYLQFVTRRKDSFNGSKPVMADLADM
jgi:hypothetical protein